MQRKRRCFSGTVKLGTVLEAQNQVEVDEDDVEGAMAAQLHPKTYQYGADALARGRDPNVIQDHNILSWK